MYVVQNPPKYDDVICEQPLSCFPETKIVSNQFNPSEFEEAGIEIRRRCLVMSGVGGSGLEQEQTKLLEGWHVGGSR